MQEQQSLPEMDASSESKTPNMVPYERFAEVNKQLKELRAELAMLKLGEGTQEQQDDDPKPTTEDVFKRMVEDPEGYLSELMGRVLQHEVQLMREEMELQSALRFARQKHPEFKSFENYILQELMSLLDSDPAVEKLSWEDMIDKAFNRLQEKFKTAVQKNPEQFTVDSVDEVKKAFMEGGTSRKPLPKPASFNRKEIANMSLEDFIRQEAAIDEALRSNRIR